MRAFLVFCDSFFVCGCRRRRRCRLTWFVKTLGSLLDDNDSVVGLPLATQVNVDLISFKYNLHLKTIITVEAAQETNKSNQLLVIRKLA